MKCEDCSKKIELPKMVYSNEKWTVIESWIPTEDIWLQMAFRTIDSVRQYWLLGEVDSVVDVVYGSDDTGTNKQNAYNEWNALEERMWQKLG